MNPDIHALLQAHAGTHGHLEHLVAQCGRIDLRHIRETRSPGIHIGSDKRIGAHEVQMIGDEHDTAHLEKRIESTGRIGQNDRADPQSRHHPGCETDLVGRVPLVEMVAPLQDQTIRSLVTDKPKAASVPLDGRDGKSGYSLEIDPSCRFKGGDETTQSASQRNTQRRRKITCKNIPDMVHSSLDFFAFLHEKHLSG